MSTSGMISSRKSFSFILQELRTLLEFYQGDFSYQKLLLMSMVALAVMQECWAVAFTLQVHQ
ncbi:hypothetical protein ElyMa_000044200, partial [Elysia marginata]